jgi:hypothetical protein
MWKRVLNTFYYHGIHEKNVGICQLASEKCSLANSSFTLVIFFMYFTHTNAPIKVLLDFCTCLRCFRDSNSCFSTKVIIYNAEKENNAPLLQVSREMTAMPRTNRPRRTTRTGGKHHPIPRNLQLRRSHRHILIRTI